MPPITAASPLHSSARTPGTRARVLWVLFIRVSLVLVAGCGPRPAEQHCIDREIDGLEAQCDSCLCELDDRRTTGFACSQEFAAGATSVCYGIQPADADPAMPGLQFDCNAEAYRTSSTFVQALVVRACTPNGEIPEADVCLDALPEAVPCDGTDAGIRLRIDLERLAGPDNARVRLTCAVAMPVCPGDER